MGEKFIRVTVFGAIAAFIHGCATAPAINCPPLKSYTMLEQETLANELVSKDGPESRAQISDYFDLRDACRKG
jgi:hypothetical protein